MKAYFSYLTKTKWLQTVVMALIPTFIFVLGLALNNPAGSSRGLLPNNFGISVIYISIVSIVIVVFRYSSLKNPKEVDLYYALPISRKKLYLVHALFGFLQLMFVWTVMFIFGFITFLMISHGYYNAGFILLLYIVAILYLAILYSITIFIFLRANTIFDGIAFILLFHILFLFISLFLSNGVFPFFQMFGLNPFYALSSWTLYLLSLANPRPSGYSTAYFMNSFLIIIFNTLLFMSLSIVSFIYNYKTIELDQTEKIGQISDGKFGYRLYIPLIMIFAISSIFFIGAIITWLLIGIFVSAGFIGFFILRRTAKIKLIDIGYIIVPALIGIILGILIN